MSSLSVPFFCASDADGFQTESAPKLQLPAPSSFGGGHESHFLWSSAKKSELVSGNCNPRKSNAPTMLRMMQKMWWWDQQALLNCHSRDKLVGVDSKTQVKLPSCSHPRLEPTCLLSWIQSHRACPFLWRELTLVAWHDSCHRPGCWWPICCSFFVELQPQVTQFDAGRPKQAIFVARVTQHEPAL